MNEWVSSKLHSSAWLSLLLGLFLLIVRVLGQNAQSDHHQLARQRSPGCGELSLFTQARPHRMPGMPNLIRLLRTENSSSKDSGDLTSPRLRGSFAETVIKKLNSSRQLWETGNVKRYGVSQEAWACEKGWPLAMYGLTHSIKWHNCILFLFCLVHELLESRLKLK